MRLGVGDQRCDEARHGLAVRLRHLCEGLAARELGSQLLLAQSEVARRGVEAAEHTAVMEATVRTREQREVAGLEALLQRVAFGLRDAACRNCGVDPVAQR